MNHRIVNFSHPMTETQIEEVAEAAGFPDLGTGDLAIHDAVHIHVRVQLDLGAPLWAQVEELLDGISPKLFRSGGAVWVLPRLTEAAAVMVAQLLDRVPAAYPIRVVRMVQDNTGSVTVFRLGEIITLREGTRTAPAPVDPRNPLDPGDSNANLPENHTGYGLPFSTARPDADAEGILMLRYDGPRNGKAWVEARKDIGAVLANISIWNAGTRVSTELVAALDAGIPQWAPGVYWDADEDCLRRAGVEYVLFRHERKGI